MTDSKVLPFTGERFTPECNGGIWYEHWHRYALAADLARGKVVVDAACGEGYGSAFLSQHARSVVGIDVSSAAVEHAVQRYRGIANLRFHCCSVTALPLEAASVDLIVSFETVEHLAEQEAMLREFRRVLKPDGMLLISSPNRPVYSDEKDYRNEYHVRELGRAELAQLLAREFPRTRWYAQRLLFNSVFWAEDEDSESARPHFGTVAEGRPVDLAEPAKPMYYVVLCGGEKVQLPVLPPVSLFADPHQTVYQEYDRLMRYQWEARERMDRLNEQVHAQSEARARAEALVAALAAEKGELKKQLREQDARTAALEGASQELAKQAQHSANHARELQSRLKHRESLIGWLKLPFHRLKRLLGPGA